MKITRTKTVETSIVVDTDIKCNNCGESCCMQPITDDQFDKIASDDKHILDAYGLIEAKVNGGYSSPELIDMNMYEFSLCEKCLKILFDNFKIPPLVRSFDNPVFRDENSGNIIEYDPNWKENARLMREDRYAELLKVLSDQIPLRDPPPGWTRSNDYGRVTYTNEYEQITVIFSVMVDQYVMCSIESDKGLGLGLDEAESVRKLFLEQLHPLEIGRIMMGEDYFKYVEYGSILGERTNYEVRTYCNVNKIVDGIVFTMCWNYFKKKIA